MGFKFTPQIDLMGGSIIPQDERLGAKGQGHRGQSNVQDMDSLYCNIAIIENINAQLKWVICTKTAMFIIYFVIFHLKFQ